MVDVDKRTGRFGAWRLGDLDIEISEGRSMVLKELPESPLSSQPHCPKKYAAADESSL